MDSVVIFSRAIRERVADEVTFYKHLKEVKKRDLEILGESLPVVQSVWAPARNRPGAFGAQPAWLGWRAGSTIGRPTVVDLAEGSFCRISWVTMKTLLYAGNKKPGEGFVQSSATISLMF